ncbi:hypothetical protein BGX34_007664 [Mortierella sp. NVP85]|nr:hypothetical protein BGX34_007664 [Mortierella sp. NVP85]
MLHSTPDRDVVVREVIDLTEDDGGDAGAEIDLTGAGGTVGEKDIDLSEADVSMVSALNMMFDFSDDDNFMVSTNGPKVDLVKGDAAQPAKRGVEERLDLIRSRLDGIRYLDEDPLKRLEMAVSSALESVGDRVKRRKKSNTSEAISP